MDLGLKGKHVFVTGAAGGIGAVTAQRFLEHGALVTMQYHSTSTSLESILQRYPTSSFTVQANAVDEASVIESIKRAVEKFGVIHILIVNHATFAAENQFIWEMSAEQFRRTLDVNLTGSFLFTREFARQLKDTPNCSELDVAVVLIGSTAGKFGEAGHLDYAASKSALMYGFMRSLKNELVKLTSKARVNCVAPGWVMTPMAVESVARGEHFKALQTMPLRKIATTDDCASAILILSSSVTAGHSSGTIFEVDGGMEGRALNSLEELRNPQ